MIGELNSLPKAKATMMGMIKVDRAVLEAVRREG